MRRAGLLAIALVALGAAGAAACVTRDRTCVSISECGGAFACVAGRCQSQPDDAGIAPRLAIAATSVRRVVARPTDVAYLRSADQPASVPSIVLLGRDDARLLLRFQQPIAEEEVVVEAYLLLDRVDAMDADPSPISLHVERILDPWDARSITWARQPRIEDDRSPATIVTGSGRPLVRLDVKDLVTRWKRHDPADQGLAVVVGTRNATGMTFAMAPLKGNEPDPGEPVRAVWTPNAPRLELYLQRNVMNSSSAVPSNGSVAPPPSGVPSSSDAGPPSR